MTAKTTCADCLAEKHSSNWKAIGESVVIRMSMGRGHDQTEYSFFQCGECGSVWAEYEDSGAGGHGRFAKRITKGLF